MSALQAVCRREWQGYFQTPVAYVFLVIFLLLAGALTFYMGQFFPRGVADMQPFFAFHPWLYLFLVPAVGMRLWAEERRSGTMELLLTMPVGLWDAVLGKFLAAWLFIGLALLLTVPMWWTVGYLGAPDHGLIVAQYVASWLLSGACLAIASALSAATTSQVVAFVTTVMLLFVLLFAGFPMVTEAMTGLFGQKISQAVAQLSLLSHYQSIARGVLDVRDVLYFALMIALWLWVTVWVIRRQQS